MDKIWTGERMETFVFKDSTVEHLHRYAFCFEHIKTKIVLDIASGEGYGSDLLSQYAEKVIGVDIDEKSIANAKLKYERKNLEFRVGQADKIPVADDSIDVVVSFETLEHHDKHDEMFKEINRILKSNGILIISTPEKKVYSDERNHTNPFHIKELYEEEFVELVKKHFTYTQFYGQSIIKGSLIIPSEKRPLEVELINGTFDNINKDINLASKYIIAIASKHPLQLNNSFSFFDGNDYSQLEQEQLVNNAIISEREKTTEWLMNSWNFKIGQFILSPFRGLKKAFNK